MSAAASRTYSSAEQLPCSNPQDARCDSFVLMPGTYVKGTVLGQMSTLTNQADVQTLSTTGTVSGGTFILAFDGYNTSAIAYNAAAAAIQAALEALPSIGTGNVVCTGGALPGTPVVCTFAGALINRPMPNITVYANSTTGTNPVIVSTHTTLGRSAAGVWKAYDDSLSDGSQIAKGILRFGCYVDSFGNHKAGGGEWGQGVQKSAPVWTAGEFLTSELTGLDANGVGDLGKIIKGSVGSLSNAATVIRLT